MNIIIKENWGCALHPRTIASIAFISRSFGFPSSISPLSPCPRLLFRHLSIHADLRSLHLCLFEIRFLSPRSSCEFALFCKFRCFLGIFLAVFAQLNARFVVPIDSDGFGCSFLYMLCFYSTRSVWCDQVWGFFIDFGEDGDLGFFFR